MATKSYKTQATWLKKYLRLVNYIAVAELYLKDNFLLEKELKIEHIKDRILGHWGTVPGLNLIYGTLNYVIKTKKQEILLITGPGHGAPAILANVFLEGSMGMKYPELTVNKKGLSKLIKDFSWPYSNFPSHVTPTVPGSILEGGELGYSLSTAYGAALDNPNLIVATIIGDGESESGPLAASWHANKFLNPKTSGAVLPILHANGYKISNPTIPGVMSDEEITNLYTGLGYEPMIINGPNIEEKTLKTFEDAIAKIKEIQSKARKSKSAILKPKWPMIVLRSKKGESGPKNYMGHPIEDSFHSHGIPIENLNTEKDAFPAIKKWLESYKVNELIDIKTGKPKAEILKNVPTGILRMGLNKHSIGGNMLEEIKISKLSKNALKFKNAGETKASSMIQAGKFFRDLYKNNNKNFRLFCPDEIESNKLSAIFEETDRAFMWPLPKNAEHCSPEGRAIEMLSEHTLFGMMQGYILTGRYGVFVSYEAFTQIISSMVDQYAKFLKQSFNVKWRTPVAPAIFINSSVGWRQEHNGYSHQNPSFVSNILQKHAKFTQIYYPADANMMLVALEECLKSKDKICAIIAEKRDLPQWLTLNEAKKQAKTGIGIWDFITSKKDAKNPDIVLASAGDYISNEAIHAAKLVKELAPTLKLRYVNVSELTALSLGDNNKYSEKDLYKYFTKDKPVIFSYHGYVNDLKQILWPYTSSDRFSLHGYSEEGSTTTPFDLLIRNGVSRFQLAKEIFEKSKLPNKKRLIKKIDKMLEKDIKHIKKFGTDPKELE